MQTYAYFADGKWLEPARGEYFDSENPYDGEVWAQIPRCYEKDVNIAVQAAYRAHHEGPWGRMNPGERGAMLRRLGDAVVQHANRLYDTVHGVCGGIFPPAGQSCIAGSRLLLQEGIYKIFVEKLHEVTSPATLEDPNDPQTSIGPIANDSDFGPAAGIWTEDHRRALDLANRLEMGTVYLNNYFDACPQSPLGGYKKSGYGRENGWDGMGCVIFFKPRASG